jgi:hypothetical protein
MHARGVYCVQEPDGARCIYLCRTGGERGPAVFNGVGCTDGWGPWSKEGKTDLDLGIESPPSETKPLESRIHASSGKKEPASDVMMNSTRIISMKNGIEDVTYAGNPPEIHTIEIKRKLNLGSKEASLDSHSEQQRVSFSTFLHHVYSSSCSAVNASV